MIVVSNTSPVTNLAVIGQLNLLPVLFNEIYLPAGVVAELSAGGVDWPGAVEIRTAPWVRVKEVNDRPLVEALRLELDGGEAETIALALEAQAGLVLLDEQAGRYVAQHFKLKVMGVVGLLLRAKQVGQIVQVRPHLESLRQQAGFYLNDSVYRHALELAGE